MVELKSRIKSVESTQKITKSMKLVATSKLHQCQGQLRNFSPYADNCARALSMVLGGSGAACPLLERREGAGKVCSVLFVGNRGLCGSYNQDIVRFLQSSERKGAPGSFTVVCGRWGAELQRDPRLNVRRCFTELGDVPSVEESDVIAEYLIGLFLDGEADEVRLFFQRHSGLGQRPEMELLLPASGDSSDSGGDCIFEPDRETLLNTLSRMYVSAGVRRALLEARVSEHFARMTAMTSATDNADELLRELTLTLNRTRQAKITTEISEVVGGAKALDGKDGQ